MKPTYNEWNALYGLALWRKTLRPQQLAKQPFCEFCADLGIVEEATVADHIEDHKGDLDLFSNPDNLRSLCKPCHDGTRRRGFSDRVGSDGWPIDPRHPANAKK